MADSDSKNPASQHEPGGTPGPQRQSATRPSKRKPKNPSQARRTGSKVDHSAPKHQARVFAMQALFEDDLTQHGLDDILQHLGEHTRSEHEQYHSRIRGEARKALEETGFLSRNADIGSEAGLAQFRMATDAVQDGLFPVPDAAEADPADEYFSPARRKLERLLKREITTYRNNLERFLLETGDGDDAGGAAERERAMVEMEASANLELEAVLGREERTARGILMDVIRHSVTIARGVEANQPEIDPIIQQAAPEFPIPQLASIDRSVLRVAIYELLHDPEVPFKVVVNEAVEIAKQFGGPNSGRFVNGVLRTISERLPAARKAPPVAS